MHSGLKALVSERNIWRCGRQRARENLIVSGQFSPIFTRLYKGVIMQPNAALLHLLRRAKIDNYSVTQT
jgi:hypothetical protein